MTCCAHPHARVPREGYRGGRFLIICSPRRHVRLAVVSLAVAATGCRGGNNGPSGPPAVSARNVKYKITGNYSGALTVAYISESSATVAAEILALPWSKFMTFPRGAVGLGIGGGSAVGRCGLPGQTISVQIFSGDQVMKSEVATTTSSGLRSLSSLALLLP